MKRTIKTSFRSALGFTLVELIIVIAILAIMAAVVVPTFANLRKKTQEDELKRYLADVKIQVAAMKEAYNNALKNEETPRFAGYNISTARGMQECLRGSNNRAEEYDIVVTTISGEPDTVLYNYIDTIVICVQFFWLTADGNYELIVDANGNPCSPEFSKENVVVKRCDFGSDDSGVYAWYIHVDGDTSTVKKGDGWQ